MVPRALPRGLPLLMVATVLAAGLAPQALAQEPARPQVVLVEVEDVVGPGSTLDLEDAVAEAEARDAPLVVRLNTPGGLVTSTREIVETLLEADVPVITHVGPRGAFAFSAGTYILLAGDVATMVNGTSMGSAMPVQSGPGGTSAADQKTINALASFMRTIAETQHRPVDLAEEMVRNNTDYTASEARDVRLINATGEDLRDVLAGLHGRAVEVDGDVWVLDTEDARIHVVEPSLASQIVRVISNPQVSFLLLAVGFYGLIFGLAAGGTYVPETIGAILVLLGLIGLGTFDFSTAGVLLIALAAVFFVAEALTPTHGILTVAGAVVLAIGGLLLPSEPLFPQDALGRFRTIVLGTSAFTGLFVFVLVTYGVSTLKDHEVHESVEGRRGTALTPVGTDDPGQVRVRGEVWRAVSEDPLDEGDDVEVVARDGLTLTVRKALDDDERG